MSRYSPLAALGAGLVAGFAGAVAQNIFLAATRTLAPSPRADGFQPAWPHRSPVKNHLYALAARGVYAAAVAGTFEGLARAATPATAVLGSLWLTRRVPRLLRPTARRLAYRGIRVALPVRNAIRALT